MKSQSDLTWTVEREVEDLIYHLDNMCTSWRGKFVFGSVLSIVDALLRQFLVWHKGGLDTYADTSGGDPFLLTLLLLFMCVNLILGLLRSIYKRSFSARVFVRGVAKYPLYALYVFLVAGISVSMEHALGIQAVLVLNLFVAYLVACESFSIVHNLELLGVRVPPLLLFIMKGFSSRVQAMMKGSSNLGSKCAGVQKTGGHEGGKKNG